MSEQLAFSVEDVIKLIAASRQHCLSEFSGGGVSFRLVNDYVVRASHTDTATTTKQPKDLDQLLIEDPRAFEEAMREID